MGEKEKDQVTISSVKIWILNVIAKQGFSIFLLCAVGVTLWMDSSKKDALIQNQIKAQDDRMQSRIESLELQMIDCNNYTRQTMETTIQENTEAMREVLYELKRLRE